MASYEFPEDALLAERRAEADRALEQRALSRATPLQLFERYHPAVLAELEREQQCVACLVQYRELDSLGTWSCRYHSGGQERGVWLCCGRSSEPGHPRYEPAHPRPGRPPPGCLPCDHRPAELRGDYTGLETAEVPLMLRPVLEARRPGRLRAEAIVEVKRDGDHAAEHTLVLRRAQPWDEERALELRAHESRALGY